MKAVILAGGRSRRMGKDKALMSYREDGKPQWVVMGDLLKEVVDGEVLYSLRGGQEIEGMAKDAVLRDAFQDKGPVGAIATALIQGEDCLVVACDLPLLDAETLKRVVHAHKGGVTCFKSRFDGRPEPLCAVWGGELAGQMNAAVEEDRLCARHLIEELAGGDTPVSLLALESVRALDNANTPEDAAEVVAVLKDGGEETVKIRLFGGLAGRAGRQVDEMAYTGKSVGEAFRCLVEEYGIESEMASSVRFAVNEVFVEGDHVLEDGDELALMPPFAGG